MMKHSLSGFDIRLEIPDGVFQPTTTTQLLVQHMGNLDGKVVLDLGCGSGPVAITAALKGAKKVYAVDIMPEACEAAERNARLNGVSDRVEVMQGDLFDPVNGFMFDVIIDDVSGMAHEVSRISPWYPETIPTGGEDGTEPTLHMLRKSRHFLTSGGYLLFPVISLSCTERTLSTAKELYQDNLSLLVDKLIPFCAELKSNIELLERLKSEGLISFIQKRSRYFWTLAIYRAEA